MGKLKVKGLPFNEVERSIRLKKFSPVYLFFGEEDFLIEQLIDLLIAQALDVSTKGFNLDVIDGGEVDTKQIILIACAYPMMSERRIVVVWDFDKLNDKEAILKYIEKPLETTSLVLICTKPDFRLKVYKALEQSATLVGCSQLYEDKIPDWIMQRVGKLGKSITLEAAQLLLFHVGRALREIQNELDKLSIYVGKKNVIDIDDVSAVVGVSKQFNIFELQNAIGKQNLPDSFEILERMLEAGEKPTSIIIMLAKYFQKLWLIQELYAGKNTEFQIAKDLEISPYYVNNYIDAAKRYTSNHIERCFTLLTETDEALKFSSSDEKLLMTLLIYKIVNEPIKLELINFKL